MALPFATLSALTKETILPDLVDNIFKSNVVFDKLLRNAKVVGGAPRIRVPIESDKTDNYGAVAKTATLTNTPSEIATNAYVVPKNYYASIGVYGADLAQNQSPAQVISLLEASAKNARKTLADDLATDMFGTQSSAEVLGFRDCIKATGSAFEGIDPSDLSTWESNGGNGVKDIASAAITVGTIRDEIVNATDGADGPDLIITTTSLYSDFAGVLESKERLVDHKGTTQLGFTNFTYMGIPVVADSHCPSTWIFILNLSHIYFAVLKGQSFKAQPYRYAETKDIYFTYIFWRGALAVDKRSAQAGIKDVTGITS